VKLFDENRDKILEFNGKSSDEMGHVAKPESVL
jgi:hypothetical protein